LNLLIEVHNSYSDPNSSQYRQSVATTARIKLPTVPPGEERAPVFRAPVIVDGLEGFRTLDAGNITGYAAITEIKKNKGSNRDK